MNESSRATFVDTMRLFLKNFIAVLFSPQRFFNERFLTLTTKQIFALGFCGVFFGLLVGSFLSGVLSQAIARDFVENKETYAASLKSLGLTDQIFLELIKAQKAYCTLLIILSPLLSYIAPHLFGGALFLFLWLFVRPKPEVNFHKIIECAAISMTSMAFYCLPLIGPLIAMIMVAVNVSRALTMHYKITGFMKTLSIVTAMYICFFLSSTSLQLLAGPAAKLVQ